MKLLGAQRQVDVPPRMAKLLEDQWARIDPDFDRFRDTYYNSDYARTTSGATIANWVVPNHVKARRNFNPKWQKMSSQVREVYGITLDGVLFRSDKHERYHNLKTRNSAVQCHTNIDNRTNRQRNSRSAEEICYGTINKIYLHFQWPPTRSQLKAARLSKRTTRIDPSKVPVPSMVVADCCWYRTVGHEKASHLKVVKAWPDWDRDCPLSDVRNWFAMNVALWPALWSEKIKMIRSGNGDVDDDVIVDPDDAKEEEDDGDEREKTWLKSHRVVITHHDAEPTLARRR